MNHEKAVLLILDGWGIGKKDNSDAVYCAHTPFMDKLMAEQPVTRLKTYGEHVGLPEGQMGNSEVGHLNIGAGRIVYQMLTLINQSFSNKTILDKPNFRKCIELAKQTQGKVHLMGLVSNGGVHSSMEHLKNLCQLFAQEGLSEKTFIHAFLDGRDCDPKSGIGFIEEVMNDVKVGNTKVASLIGRYYAMDRDNRWERVKQAYDLLANGTGEQSQDLLASIQQAYDSEITDEFMSPIVACDSNGKALATVEEGDVVLCFNFRTDRCREITTALTQKAFPEHEMNPLKVHYFTMTEYDKTFKDVHVLFEKNDLRQTLGEYLASQNLTQLRAAETEKYPHVTFFFSGGREDEFPGEKRILVNSPKVATYDLQPEMSALELKEGIKASLETGEIDFYCVNFANPDMVGHTGVFDAIKKACETVDSCVQELVETAQNNGYKLVIIADHGNADFAINPDGSPNTAHSLNPVPCIVIGEPNVSLKPGILADVAPTILKLMKVEQPAEMTGSPLF